jgi:hypothetical protein
MPYLSVVDPTNGSPGSLYGVATQGGGNSAGYVFALVKSGTVYTYQSLYDFCGAADCADGANPIGRLVLDVNGNLYGVTEAGGLSAQQPYGTAFELVPNSDHSHWTRVTLYNFCQQSDCADGLMPVGGLTYAGETTGALYDGTSPLYGVASNYAGGLVFKLTKGKSGWKEAVVRKLCLKSGCVDGDDPTQVLADATGNLVGIAGGGKNHGGVVFRLDASSRYHENVLYAFCHKTNCADGSLPADLGMDASGHIFGVTDQGGENNNGVLFGIDANGYKVLHVFGKHSGDGGEPDTALVTSDGIIYGTTLADNTVNRGGSLFSYDASGYHIVDYFCTLQFCSDGLGPWGLAYDGGSSIFGTTKFGGSNAAGVIYEAPLQ